MPDYRKDWVLFDFDGTIADTFDLFKDTIISFKDEYFSGNPDFEKYKSGDVKGFLKSMKAPTYLLPLFLAHLKKDMAKNIGGCNTFPGIEGVLKDLSDQYALGIVSCNSTNAIKEFMEANKITPYFDFVNGESSIINKKKAIKNALEENGGYSNNSRVVYIGDEIRDINACNHLGIPIGAVTWGYNNENILKKQKYDFLFHETEDIRYLLSRLKEEE